MNFTKLKEKYENKIKAICLEDGSVLDFDQYKTVAFDMDIEAFTLTKINRRHIEGQVIETKEETTLYPFTKVVAVKIWDSQSGGNVIIPIDKEIKATPEVITSLNEKETMQLTADVNVTYSSENSNIASVDDKGLVTGRSKGTTNIVLKAVGYKDKKIPVTVTRPPSKIPSDPTKVEGIKIGETLTITSIAPNVKFASEDEKIATVDAKGLIKGISAGSTNLLLTAEGYLDTKVPVTVSADNYVPPKIKCPPQDLTGMELVEKTTATLSPDAPNTKFVSGDEKIITVDSKGLVTAVAVGETTVTLSAEGYSDLVIKAKVITHQTYPIIPCLPETVPSLEVGATTRLTTSEGAKYKSDNDKVATVDETGVITGVAEGTANITISADQFTDRIVPVTVVGATKTKKKTKEEDK